MLLFITYLRRKTGLTQSKFSELVNIPVDTIKSWESGRRVPSMATMREVERRVVKAMYKKELKNKMDVEEVREYFVAVLEKRKSFLEDELEHVEPHTFYTDSEYLKEECKQYKDGYRDGYLELLRDILGLMQESDFGM